MSQPTASRPLPAILAGMTDQAFLQHLLAHGPASRAEISRITGISKPTISESATRLLAAGLIIEAGETTPRGRGRRALLYRVNPDCGHVSAVILERRHLVVRALDFSGELRWENSSTADLNFREGISWARQQLIEAAECLSTPCHAATISVAAPVNPRTGEVHPMSGAPLAGHVPDITTELGLQHVPQVSVDNDVNWAALAEATDPTQDPGRSFIYVYLGAGIGGALVAEGKVIRGANGAAGEISFLRTPKGTTLHQELSSLSFGSPDRASIDVDLALSAFNNPIESEFTYAADLIATAILNAATVFDPGTVIIGGPLSAADPLIEHIRQNLQHYSLAPVTLIRSQSDDELLSTGVSRHAVQDAWNAALATLAPAD